MRFRKCYWLVFICLLVGSAGKAEGKKIKSPKYKFSITIPDAMKYIVDTTSWGDDLLYYDTVSDVIFMISERKSKFKRVTDYIDCSKEKLESQLRDFYSDTALILRSCSRSLYFPQKTTAILIKVSVLPHGYTNSMVYFVHHKKRDLQFSFTYKDESLEIIGRYIDGVMSTLKLK